MIMTDPPYNVAVEGGTEKKLTILNDSMSDDAFTGFLEAAFRNMDAALKAGGGFYIWYAHKSGVQFEEACKRVGWEVRQTLIWAKNHFTLGRQDYQWKHEPCLYGWKDGSAHYFTDSRNLITVIEEEFPDIEHMKKEDMKRLLEKILTSEIPVDIIHEDKPLRNADHPTMKPLRLIGQLIQNSSKRGDKVLDLFGGSGSTLMACEQLGRRCFTMELDPRYADVIIDRWEIYTGQKAEKVSG
ncbi:MAG: site-specific DNA-methyltransferase [Candidatus Methanomethylophilaceae archaeon]|nr:site-specific DNA-methyltransferase [Candidatus Methanomethylophilaceae archaeon]